MLEKPSNTDNPLSKEDYLIMRAKQALPIDIYAAKSWLITAKSLFPHSAKVQVSAGTCALDLSLFISYFSSLLFLSYEVIHSEEHRLVIFSNWT